MGRIRWAATLISTILFTIGVLDGVRSIYQCARMAYIPRKVKQCVSQAANSGQPKSVQPKSDRLDAVQSVKLVESLGYEPESVCNPLDTPIEFDVSLVVGGPGTQYRDILEGLQFRLQEYSDKWSVVYDWRSWPLPPYHASRPGMVALQVDVRRKDDPEKIDSRWLNQFSFLRDVKPCQNSLVRELLAIHFDVLDEEKLRDLLADELQLAIAVLRNDHIRMNHEEQINRLRKLSCVVRIVTDSPSETITLRSGSVVHWNWQQRTLQEEGKTTALRVGAADLPEYGELFRRCASLPEDAVTTAATAFSVQLAYYYGTPKDAASWSARNSVASCEQLALILHRLLAGSGVSTKLIGLRRADNGACHILVQAVTAESKIPMLIDPTAGCYYLCDARTISVDNIPDPIFLPHSRSIPGCDLRSLVDISSTILRYDFPQRRVFPAVFGSTSVIVEPKSGEHPIVAGRSLSVCTPNRRQD